MFVKIVAFDDPFPFTVFFLSKRQDMSVDRQSFLDGRDDHQNTGLNGSPSYRTKEKPLSWQRKDPRRIFSV